VGTCSITIGSGLDVRIGPDADRVYLTLVFGLSDVDSFGLGGSGIGTLGWVVPLGFGAAVLIVKRPILS
jgi:hypothetical protein